MWDCAKLVSCVVAHLLIDPTAPAVTKDF
jgi:hypothetical protein